jgi:hypothetical protein
MIMYANNITGNFNLTGGGDTGIVCANIATTTITLVSGSNNWIAAGNRIATAPSDSGTGNIVSNNEISAF